MPTLVTADLHLTARPRDRYRHDFQVELRKMVKTTGAQSVVILGDLCDDKDEHSAWLVNAVVDHLVALAKIVPVYVLLGNHDYLNPDHPYWRFLRHIDGVTWIDRQTAMMIPGLEKNRCLFLPHTRDYLWDWDLKLNGFNVVFAHNTFEGAVSEGGFTLPGIPVNNFYEWQRVVSGDIHRPQKLAKNFYYVGSPYTIDFGDNFDPRVLLISDDAIRSVECPGPRKILIEAPCIRTWSMVEKGDMVKVRVKMKPQEYARWDEIRRDWEEWAKRRGVDLWKVEPLIEREMPRRGNIALVHSRDRLNDRQLVEKHSKSQQADKQTMKTGLTLIKE